jgi:hypothetical protein
MMTVERARHSSKQYPQSFSTEEGMQMDESEEQFRKAEASIQTSLEPDSNVTVERDSHSAKDCRQSLSTEEGMQIDESEEQFRNAES